MKRIREAAFALFAEQGYGATTIEQIADRAEVSVGTVYNYYGSKIQLLAQGLFAMFAEMEQEIDAAIAQLSGPPSDVVSDWLVGAFEEMPFDRDLLRELWAALMHPQSKVDDYVRGYLDQYFDLVTRLLTHCQRIGTLSCEIDLPRAVRDVVLVMTAIEVHFYMGYIEGIDDLRSRTHDALEPYFTGLEEMTK